MVGKRQRTERGPGGRRWKEANASELKWMPFLQKMLLAVNNEKLKSHINPIHELRTYPFVFGGILCFLFSCFLQFTFNVLRPRLSTPSSGSTFFNGQNDINLLYFPCPPVDTSAIHSYRN